MIKNETQTILQKHLILNQRFRYQNTPLSKQKFLAKINFQLSQSTQKKFKQLAELLLKTQWFTLHLNLM